MRVGDTESNLPEQAITLLQKLILFAHSNFEGEKVVHQYGCNYQPGRYGTRSSPSTPRTWPARYNLS